jgi:hypothetical protein
MQIDLGGVCGEHSWLRPLSDLMGWREAFLDRILMSVLLVSAALAGRCQVLICLIGLTPD